MESQQYITLFRPVGLKEMELIAESNYKKFPPRLEWQPIFYPVLNQAYAEQIALEWNTKDEFSGNCGIVTKFEISSAFLENYTIQNVGGEMHNELWIPAEDLNSMNENIIGEIKIVNAFFGLNYKQSKNEKLENILKKYK